MAYCEASDVKTYLGISGNTDDLLIDALVERAQQAIDTYCDRTFEASADTDRSLDAVADVDGRTLFVNDDLYSIASITNGDSVAVTAAEYVTEPRHFPPFYAVRLLASSDASWTYEDDPENAITISGKWAYSEEAPLDIVHACIRLAAYFYRQKDAQTYDTTASFELGILTIPKGWPADVKEALSRYRRIVL